MCVYEVVGVRICLCAFVCVRTCVYVGQCRNMCVCESRCVRMSLWVSGYVGMCVMCWYVMCACVNGCA